MTDPMVHIFAKLVKVWPSLQYGSTTVRRSVYSYIRGLATPHGKHDDTFETLLLLAKCYVNENNHL